MKVSIVTVCYNSSKTIGSTLQSVASQSWPDIEQIVIDGASTDNTLEVVREIGARVTCVVSEPDRGIYDAMNKGVALCTGDIVGFLNADDMYASPDSVAHMVSAIESAGADAVFGDLVYVRGDNADSVVRRWDSGPFRPHRLRRGWMPPHPTFYVRRAVLLAVGGFDLGFRIAADYDFMMRCLVRPNFSAAYVQEVLVNMRVGGASNASLKAMLAKSKEDLAVIRRFGLGGWLTLVCKNLRKFPQFVKAFRRIAT